MHTQTQQIQIFTYVPSSPIHTFYRVIIIWNTKSQSQSQSYIYLCTFFKVILVGNLEMGLKLKSQSQFMICSLYSISNTLYPNLIRFTRMSVTYIYQVHICIAQTLYLSYIDVNGLTFQRESFFAGSNYYLYDT